ncbi:MAG: hypothetical protein U1C59_11440 [Methylotenera sp.]|nr:hypothetical protein [Methylotenera sp.]
MPEITDIKCQRIMFFYTELSRHNIDIDAALKFMEYVFNVRAPWLMRIVKGYVPYDATPALEHSDVDLQTIDAFVRKLYKQAKAARVEEAKGF